ncbi:CHRD domain-containing protein [Paenibacillus sp. 2TAB19]
MPRPFIESYAYVNVHTIQNPNGEIRGQVKKV